MIYEPLVPQMRSCRLSHLLCEEPKLNQDLKVSFKIKSLLQCFFRVWENWRSTLPCEEGLSLFFSPAKYILWLWILSSPFYLVIPGTWIFSIFLLREWAWSVTWWLEKLKGLLWSILGRLTQATQCFFLKREEFNEWLTFGWHIFHDFWNRLFWSLCELAKRLRCQKTVNA